MTVVLRQFGLCTEFMHSQFMVEEMLQWQGDEVLVLKTIIVSHKGGANLFCVLVSFLDCFRLIRVTGDSAG